LMRDAIRTSPSILVSEPIKSGVTIAAILVARLLPPKAFRSLAARYTGAGAAA